MNYEKFLIIVVVLITFLISLGGVFAENTDNTTDDSVKMVLEDTLYEDYSDTLTNNDVDDDSIILKEDNINSSLSLESVEDNLASENNSIYSREIVTNPGFEHSNRLVGWNYSNAYVYSIGSYAEEGNRFAGLSDNGFIQQDVHLTTVDYISFYYMSDTQGSAIEVLLDDKSILKYVVQNVGMGRWNQVMLDVTNYTGFHKLKFLQHNSRGYIDNIKCIQNNDISVNFTLTSFSLKGDNLTLSFNDYSYGFIKGWLWDFGDNTNSPLQNVTHSYKTGHYTVSLTVYNDVTSKSVFYSVPISFPVIERTGMEYYSIQSAVDNAQNGDIILIPNNIFTNTFTENIIIDKNLTLNFSNCTLISDGINPCISVIGGADVVVSNISLTDCLIITDNNSKLTITQSVMKNIILSKGNIGLDNNNISDSIIFINGSNVNISNSNYINSSIIINDGNAFIFNNTFSCGNVSIRQNGGKSTIKSNIISNNTMGICIADGFSDISFNAIYQNNIGLVFNSSNIVFDNNWWGTNNPSFIYDNQIVDCDILQLGGIESNLNSWLVLNISESPYLDYNYWIAGITYYNLTIDLTHNNLGEDLSNEIVLPDFTLTLNSIDNYTYNLLYYGSSSYTLEKNIITEFNIESEIISNGKGYCIFSFGYLTNYFNELNLTVMGKNYSVNLHNISISQVISQKNSSINNIVDFPTDKSSDEINTGLVTVNINNFNFNGISHITPSCVFDDKITVEIKCNDSNAIVFYTLDGSNPGYSPTRMIYTEPFIINESTTVHYSVINRYGDFERNCIDEYIVFADSYRKQDVFVEILESDKNLYTLDGSDSTNVDKCIFYTHPFIVRDSTLIKFSRIKWYSLSESEYHFADVHGVRFSNFDFSVNYVKNITGNNVSNSIWSQYQGDKYNTGVTNITGPVTNVTSWSNAQITSSGSALVDDKGRIIIGGDDGYLYYLNNQGLVIWKYGTSSKIICTPTLGSDGNIYFSNWWNSSVYCISTNGTLIWKYNLGGFNTGTSPVFGIDNKLYILTSNGNYSNMYVFTSDGVLIGNHSIPLISASTPAVGRDGTLYMVSANHELVVVNNDGSLRYAKYLKQSSYLVTIPFDHISVSVDENGHYYVMQGQHNDKDGFHFSSNVLSGYYANGTVKWINSLNNYFVSGTPTYYEGVLYVTCNLDKHEEIIDGKWVRMDGGRLLAFNATNGDLLWSEVISSSGNTFSSPLISGDGLVYVTSNNTVYAFTRYGDKIWQYTMTGDYGNPFSYASPTLSNRGTLIVTTNQGIFAFNDISADFTYSYVNGTASTIQFTDLSTEGENRYLWDFGDGNYSVEQNPIHEYAEGGKYRVVLYVEHDGVMLARNTTINVVYHDINPPSNVSAYINNTETWGGVFNSTQYVSLNASDDYSSVIIYYTLDGSNPLNSSTRKVYSRVLDVEVDTVLTCVAVDGAGNIGNISSFTFKITDVVYINITDDTGYDSSHNISDDTSGNSTGNSTGGLPSNSTDGSQGNSTGDLPSNSTGNSTGGLPSNSTDTYKPTLVDRIQAILDGLDPYSKVVLDYDLFEGVNFTIKKPLNIITTKNTKLIGNGVQPVFTFSENASGSIINGFVIENSNAEGILLKNNENITVRNCIVSGIDSVGINSINSTNTIINSTTVVNSTDGIVVNKSSNTVLDNVLINNSFNNGVWIVNSQKTIISNSLLESNGDDWYASKANQVLIDDSKDTVFFNNVLKYGFFGVHLYHTTDNTTIFNNTFYESVGDAILLSNTYSNVNITYNIIDGCYNGVDFMGYSENVSIVRNVIENLHEHDNDLYSFPAIILYQLADYVYETHFPADQFFNHCYNGIQVSYPASNFHEGNTLIIDNVVIKLQHRAWESRKYQHYLEGGCAGYGYNLFDGSASYSGEGGATRYTEGKVDLVVDRIGDATFRLRLINRLDGHYLSNIPEFNVTFRAGGFLQTVKFINDSAIATFDVGSVVSDIEAIISTEIRKSASFTMEIAEGFHGSTKTYDLGFEEGEAINNPDPVIPSMDELINKYINHNTPSNPSNPVDPQKPEESGMGNGTGDGIGNGTGSGNSSGNGTGDGMGTGNSTGSGNSTGNITDDSGSGDGNSENTNPDDSGSSKGDSDNTNPVSPESPDKTDDNKSEEVPSVDSGDMSGESSSSESSVDVSSPEVEVTPVSPEDASLSEDITVSDLIEEPTDSSISADGESSASSDSSVGEQGGSSESGGSGKSYEVTKVIDLNENSWQFVLAVILFSIIIILGYGYKRNKEDGDEF